MREQVRNILNSDTDKSMQRDVKNGGYGIGEHTEIIHHQQCDWSLREVKWSSTIIGGSYTMALVRACNDILIMLHYC